MNDKFERAVKIVQELPQGSIQPTIEDKLKLYGWYKSITVGAVDTERPGALDFEGKAKWEAWNTAQTTPTADCKKLYVEKVIEILKRTETEEATRYLSKLE